jgi:hypothetical protein
MTTRKLDSDALRTYRNTVQSLLETLEDQLIPRLENGNELGRMPAFGYLQSSETAKSNYETFHSTTWENLQSLREAMHGIIKTLNESGDLSDESDEQSAAEIESQLQ